MIESITVKILGEDREVSKNTTFLELSKMYKDQYKFPILLAKQNNNYKELRDKVCDTGEITFLDLTDSEGNRVYLNGLVYLTIFAFKTLFKGDLKVRHSIDKGLYIETNFELNEYSY